MSPYREPHKEEPVEDKDFKMFKYIVNVLGLLIAFTIGSCTIDSSYSKYCNANPTNSAIRLEEVKQARAKSEADKAMFEKMPK